ncbi:hypothetical protein LCL96_00295 [Rossellomorea aquimaris]|uniref:hypothetical protein n=1 Tax=Rossellomorea TaxID=2837508 RepID=UPI001CD6CE1A|nr:hypothetical protein [Rossellomorea aquimaris]MCA1057352.1 hypothetical protein [Rossellomorea aquimaris]
MDQTSTDNQGSHILMLKKEMLILHERIMELEKEVKGIQAKCRHVFYETPAARNCIKCHYAESTYY